MNKLVGSRIKRAREEAGLTQAELADYLNVSAPLITKIERGTSSLTVKRLFDLPPVLLKPVGYFLGLDIDMSDDEVEWMEFYRSLGTDTERRCWRSALRCWLREKGAEEK